MTVLAEGDLRIKLPAGASGRQFDDETVHGLSHCMKAVDFVVELQDRTLFIELKDPEDPFAQPEARKAFMQKVLSGALDADLKTKFRDTLLYEWASGRATKPIYFFVLIGSSSLSAADLISEDGCTAEATPDERPWWRVLASPPRSRMRCNGYRYLE